MSQLNIDMELVRTFTPEQYARGLLAWAWLRPQPMEPIFASAFGDVFFRAADGTWWLVRHSLPALPSRLRSS
jgi:hypothetical protein